MSNRTASVATLAIIVILAVLGYRILDGRYDLATLALVVVAAAIDCYLAVRWAPHQTRQAQPVRVPRD